MSEQTTNDPSAHDVLRAHCAPQLDGGWDGPGWEGVPPLDVASFHPGSSAHRPRTQAKIVYDDDGLHVQFQVEDQYVLCRQLKNQGSVCLDSCTEFFFQPDPARGYFNLEVNCGGWIHLAYHTSPDQRTFVSDDWLAKMRVHTTLPRHVEPEIMEPLTWIMAVFMPFDLFEAHMGPFGTAAPRPNTVWRANFYKCADESSHPHWGSWAPIGEKLNFHQPEYFGAIRFV